MLGEETAFTPTAQYLPLTCSGPRISCCPPSNPLLPIEQFAWRLSNQNALPSLYHNPKAFLSCSTSQSNTIMATKMRLNSSALRGLRRPVSCRPQLGRQQQRFNATNTGSVNQAAFWTTNKVLLLSAFTGALAYTYGIWDAGSSYKKDAAKADQPPVYAKRAEMEKVFIDVSEFMRDWF